MKKEIYVKPQLEVIEMEMTDLLAASPYNVNEEQGNQIFLGRERRSLWDEE